MDGASDVVLILIPALIVFAAGWIVRGVYESLMQLLRGGLAWLNKQ